MRMMLVLLHDGHYQTFAEFEDEKCKKFCKKLQEEKKDSGVEILMGPLKIRQLTVQNMANRSSLYLKDFTRNVFITGDKYVQFYDDGIGAEQYLEKLSEEELANTYLIQGESANGFEVWQYDIPIGTKVYHCPDDKTGMVTKRFFDPEMGVTYLCTEENEETFSGYDTAFELAK